MPESRPRFLMCRPEHFGVVYTINPWMNPKDWERQEHALSAASQQEWMSLHRSLCDLGAAVELVPAAPGLPDLVFTANAAVVLDRKALLARFRYPQRQMEERHFETAFRSLQARGLIDAVRTLPDGVILEGAGDCVYDRARNLFWMGYGPRSDAAAKYAVRNVFGVNVIALELNDARFYHMDTALCPLPRGEVMYFPSAFTTAGRATIQQRVAPQQRIEISMDDARQFAANAVCIGNSVVMSACSASLRSEIEKRGYRVTTTPLHSFLRSGGAAFCLTLQLNRESARPLRGAGNIGERIKVSAIPR